MIYKIKDVLTVHEKNDKHQWNAVEQEIGFNFPKDYKEFINLYGEGGVNEFLWVMSPFSEYENLNIKKRLPEMKDAYAYMKKQEPDRFKLDFYNGEKGLFPWGVTDNGDELYWNIKKEKTNVVVYASRYTEIKEYEMTMVEFLYKVLSREVSCSIFPDDFLTNENFYEL